MKKLLAIPFLVFLLSSPICKAQYTDLHDFNDTGSVGNTNGYSPYGNLIISGNEMYGVATNSGVGGFGTVFSIRTDGTRYKDLHDFNGSAGSLPDGTLTLLGHKLYGCTNAGGAHGYGVIFSIDTTGGAYTVLWNFAAATGGNSYFGALAFYKDKLYGMTQLGGASNLGVVFSFDTVTNIYTDLFDFNGTNGKKPEGSVIYTNGKLYGVTYQGGSSGMGNVFSMDTTGNYYKDLVDFTGANGSYPGEGRLQVSGKVLYGFTNAGGLHGQGSMYSVDTNGSNFNLRYSFTTGDPYGSPTLCGNLIYGMTYVGGAGNIGTIFSLDTNGTGYSTLLQFNGTNGKNPFGDVTVANNGILYGMTFRGGANSYGLIFSDDICNLFTATSADSSIMCHGSNMGVAYTTGASGGPTPYTYLWSPGGNTNSRATGLSAGTYTLTVTDLIGCSSTSSVTITQPALLTSSASVTANEACNGDNTGSLSSTISGGTVPYTYTWTPLGGSNSAATALTAGTYTLTVTDKNGCSSTSSVTITQPVILTSSANVTADEACNGDNTGSLSSTVGGGTVPYTYVWTPGGGSSSAVSLLTAGTYTLNVTDKNGCTSTSSVTITQPSALASAHDSIADNGSSNGTAGVVVSGGTTPYTYSWAPGGQTIATATGLSAGIYTCTVHDQNGCTYTTSVKVNSTAGVNTISSASNKISVYPNPSSGKFSVICHSERSEESLQIKIYNILGESVLTETLRYSQGDNLINISSQPEGIYLYRVISNTGSLIGEGKLVIQSR